MESIRDTISLFGTYLPLVIFFLYLSVLIRHTPLRSIRFFVLYFGCIASLQIFNQIYIKFDLGNNNHFLSHFYFISQLIALSGFYYFLFNPLQKKVVITVTSSVLLVLLVQFWLYPEKLLKFNLLEVVLCSLPLIGYSIVHLYNSLTYSKRFALINAGVLIYLSTSALIFLLANKILLSGERDFALNIWNINNTLYLGYLILIMVEWIKNRKQWIRKKQL